MFKKGFLLMASLFSATSLANANPAPAPLGYELGKATLSQIQKELELTRIVPDGLYSHYKAFPIREVELPFDEKIDKWYESELNTKIYASRLEYINEMNNFTRKRITKQEQNIKLKRVLSATMSFTPSDKLYYLGLEFKSSQQELTKDEIYLTLQQKYKQLDFKEEIDELTKARYSTAIFEDDEHTTYIEITDRTFDKTKNPKISLTYKYRKEWDKVNKEMHRQIEQKETEQEEKEQQDSFKELL